MSFLLLAAMILIAVSGLPGLALRRDSDLGQTIAHLLHSIGSVLGIGVAVRVLFSGTALSSVVGIIGDNWALTLSLDALGAVFLLPILIVTNLSSLFGLDYWRQSKGASKSAFVRVMYGIITAGLFGVVCSGDMISFLIAWEFMAIAAFFLIITDEHIKEVRSVGWMYFVTTHVSTLLLFGLFALAWSACGSHLFADLGNAIIDHSVSNVLFIMALVAFGLKAGVFPGHYWLPPAHASAPSHVSALMSGVLIKIGIYGLMRMVFLLRSEMEPWWGTIVLTLGIFSSILGVSFALGQHDLKKLLACHSFENIGIILLGLGVAMVGSSWSSTEMIVLGMTGSILHVWNHALFKSLLFLSAGAVIHSAGTREIDALGGLGRLMPRTSAFFLFGAIAICGLPPLNGFVSEILIYLGMLRGISSMSSYLMVGGCLALAVVGGLAVGCFVKAFGAVFLGVARSDHAENCHEASRLMQIAMGGLAMGCLIVAFAPQWAVGLLSPAVELWLPRGDAVALLNSRNDLLTTLSYTNVSLALMAVLLCALASLRFRRDRIPTWDCGYLHATRSMQYSASSFAQMFVSLLSKVLMPTSREPVLVGCFPLSTSFRTAVPDIVYDRCILPLLRFLYKAVSTAKIIQRGNMQAYALYILVAFVFLMFLSLGGFLNG